MLRAKRIIGLLATLLALPATSALAQESTQAPTQQQATTWEALTGVDYYVGDYGAKSDTTVFDVPLNARIQMNRWRLEFTLPYLNVKGPGSFAGGGVVVPGSNKITERSGLGDTTVGLAWLVNPGDRSDPIIEIQGIVKIPTAGSGLGTKKFDYTLQGNFYRALTPSYLLFGSLGYQWLGDFQGFNLEDGVLGTIGINYKTMDNTSLGAVMSYRQEYWKGLGDQASLSPYVAWSLGGMWRMSAYGLVGLTDASARAGGGLRLGLNW